MPEPASPPAAAGEGSRAETKSGSFTIREALPTTSRRGWGVGGREESFGLLGVEERPGVWT